MGNVKTAPADRRRAAEIAFVGGVILLFVYFVTLRFESPGSTWDGTRTSDQAVRLWEYWRNGEYGALFPAYPLYHGWLQSYVLLPGFMAFGPGRTWAHLSVLLMNIGTLIFAYGAARSVFPRAVAALTLLLLALHPPFIMGTKLFLDGSGAVCFFPTLVFFLAARAWTLRKVGYLWAAAFAAGWGLGTFLWYAVFLAALAGTAWLFRKDIAERLRAPGWAWAGLAMLPGAVPIALYEVQHDFPSWRSAALRVRDVAPRAALENLPDFDAMMSSAHYFRELFGDGAAHALNACYGPLVLAAAGWLAGRAVFGRPAFRKGVLFLLALAAGTFALLSVAPEVTLKLFILYPLPQLFLALAAWDLFSSARAGRRLAAAAALLVVAASETATLAGYVRSLTRAGVSRNSTDTVYGLADWLNARAGEKDVVAGQTYLIGTLRMLLPAEKISGLRDIGFLPAEHSPETRAALEQVQSWSLGSRRVFFVWDGLKHELKLDPSEFELQAVFKERDGTTTLRVYRVIPPAPGRPPLLPRVPAH